MAERKNGKNGVRAGSKQTAARNGSRTTSKQTSEKNGGRVVARQAVNPERVGAELERTNVRITQQTQWLRALSHDLQRLGDKLYGLTEGRVTLADVKLPAGRYRTPDQTPVASADFVNAAERMGEVRKRFASMERDLAAADDLRDKLAETGNPLVRR